MGFDVLPVGCDNIPRLGAFHLSVLLPSMASLEHTWLRYCFIVDSETSGMSSSSGRERQYNLKKDEALLYAIVANCLFKRDSPTFLRAVPPKI